MKIAQEVQEKVKGGMAQQEAVAVVMKAHEGELNGIIGNKP